MEWDLVARKRRADVRESEEGRAEEEDETTAEDVGESTPEEHEAARRDVVDGHDHLLPSWGDANGMTYGGEENHDGLDVDHLLIISTTRPGNEYVVFLQ